MTETYTVELVDEGVTLEVPEDQSILEAAEEAGLDLPYQCRQGMCGVCCAKRLGDGQVDQLAGMFLTQPERGEGYVLTCIGEPRSDLRLETESGP
jgi:ferredoxin